MIATQAKQKHDQFLLPIRKQRLHSRQKFSVGRGDARSSCLIPGALEWRGYEENFDKFSFAISEPFNAIDALFQQAAEKVNNQVVIDRRIYGGAPCVANTRVPVYAILEMVEAGYSHKRILKAFPLIDKKGLEAALRFAILVMER